MVCGYMPTMTNIDSLIGKLRSAFVSSGLTKVALAKKAGLHINTLQHLESKEWNPKVPTIRSLEQALLSSGNRRPRKSPRRHT